MAALWTLGALAALGLGLGAGAFAAVCLCARRARGAFRQTPGRADCLIVLGARVWPDGRMSETLRLRCLCALALWRRGAARAIVACGGRGGDEPVAEAEAMRAFFQENGVPAEAVALDAASRSTRENLANARRILSDRGWTAAAIVTSDVHLTRAMWIARDAGLTAFGVAAPSPARRAARLRACARETASWALYAMRKFARR